MIEQLETWMNQRIRLFLANGGVLKRGTFGLGGDCRCAITSCYDEDAYPEFDQVKGFIRASGLPLDEERQVWAIINGFDNNPRHTHYDRAYYDLGKRLAEEYL